MVGLFDGVGGGGLLPFSSRWGDVTSAINAGLFDPQGQNAQGLFGANGMALPFAPQAGQPPGLPPQIAQPGTIPMPQPRPPDLPGTGILPQGPQLPPEMANAQAAGVGQPQGGFWGNLFNGISNGIAAHPQTLMAMAGGFGQPGWGFGNAMRAAGPAMQADQQNQLLQQKQAAAYQAIRSAGGSHAQALAAMADSEVFKALVPELFGGYKVVTTDEGPLGKTMKLQGPGGKFYDIPENGVAPGTAATGTGGGSVPSAGKFNMLAPGVAKYDPTLPANEYLAQFGPEVQGAIKARLRGDVIPTGNPRTAGLPSLAHTLAMTYAEKAGIPYSDAIYNEKRRFFTELGSTTTGAGGQAKAFQQGIEHAVDLGTKLKGLENWNGLGIPILARGANTVRQGFSNQLAATASEASSIGQTLAGEVGKLFSGSAGGGVHERELTRQRFETVKSTPELAAALNATLEMMEGGLTALEQRRDQILGHNSGVEIIPQQTREKMAQLRQVIAELRSGKSSAPATGAIPKDWTVTVR